MGFQGDLHSPGHQRQEPRAQRSDYDRRFRLFIQHGDRGDFVSVEVNYKIAEAFGPFAVMPFMNYSAYFKDRKGFQDSERYIFGTVLTYKPDPNLLIYPEFIIGRNDPYVGAGQFISGLAEGGDNRWKTRFIMNVGYYF